MSVAADIAIPAPSFENSNALEYELEGT